MRRRIAANLDGRPAGANNGNNGLNVRKDIVIGASGMSHEVSIVRVDGEDLIYVSEPVTSEEELLRLLILHLDTGLRILIDAPIDPGLYDVLLRADAIYLGRNRRSSGAS